MQIVDPDFLSHLLGLSHVGSHIEGVRDTLKKLNLPQAKITDGSVIFTAEEGELNAELLSSYGLPRSGDILREWAGRATGSRGLGAETIMPELKRSIERELRANLFLHVPEDKKKYFSGPYLFGPEVTRAFPSAGYDIEEAGKCLALARCTACVFHLMRVMELSLKTLGKTLNDPRLDPKRNPSWDAILKKCKEELEKERTKRAPEWASDDVFFSGAATMLMGVKDAWRNPTMHVEINYDEERALDVWNHVRAFMHHLATKLREET
jgi:hypothetical protein